MDKTWMLALVLIAVVAVGCNAGETPVEVVEVPPGTEQAAPQDPNAPFLHPEAARRIQGQGQQQPQ